MSRRVFLQNLTLLAAAASLPAQSSIAANSDKIRRIGFLVPSEGYDRAWDQLIFSLSRLGWSQGKNLEILTRHAYGRTEDLTALCKELIDAGVELIVTTGASAAREALKVQRNIPIISAGMVDPFASGLVTSLSQPNVNLTGVSILFDDITLKLLELAKNIDPSTSKVATLSNPTSTTADRVPAKLTTAAAAMGMTNQVFKCRDWPAISAMFEQMVMNEQSCLLVVQSPYFVSVAAEIAQLAIKNKIICLGQSESYVQAGFLGSYGVDYTKIFIQSSRYVDKILRGGTANQLPIEQASEVQIALNRHTFKALGLDTVSYTHLTLPTKRIV